MAPLLGLGRDGARSESEGMVFKADVTARYRRHFRLGEERVTCGGRKKRRRKKRERKKINHLVFFFLEEKTIYEMGF